MATRHVLLILISNIRCSDNTSISSSIVSLNFEVHFQPMIVLLSSGFLTLYDFVLVFCLCILGGFAFAMVVPISPRVPVFQKDASNRLRDILHTKISCLAKELKGAKALVNGDLVKH